MNPSDHNSAPHGPSDGNTGELRWNESEWLKFLRRNGLDQARYLKLHQAFRDVPERLDHCAKRMGWDTGEWAPADDAANIVPEAPEPEEAPAPNAPYCLHNHPVFIVTRALIGHLVRAWHYYCEKNGLGISPALAIAFSDSLRDIEHNMVMAVNGMDTRDWALGLAQMKIAHIALNNAFSSLEKLPESPSPLHDMFIIEARTCLHDLRELMLRVMNDCRFELATPREGEPGAE